MKILLIEDDRRLATTVKRGLEADGDTVDVAFDGEEGLWLAGESRYDVVILDLMLPRRNGFDVCATLRERGDWLPILVLTAKDGELDEAEALDTGADDFLTKPFSFAVLRSRLRALARRPGGTPPAPVTAGSVRVDPAAHRAWRGDTEIKLTAREFAVLEFLVRRAGQVVPKAQILDGVWSFEFDGDPNIVEVYVRRLRRKLDSTGSRGVIETLRGAGYRFADE
jgi:two-component system, OmpR family, response regulator